MRKDPETIRFNFYYELKRSVEQRKEPMLAFLCPLLDFGLDMKRLRLDLSRCDDLHVGQEVIIPISADLPEGTSEFYNPNPDWTDYSGSFHGKPFHVACFAEVLGTRIVPVIHKSDPTVLIAEGAFCFLMDRHNHLLNHESAPLLFWTWCLRPKKEKEEK